MQMLGRWRKQRNWGCRITEGTLYGLRTVTLENARLRLTFLVDKGADLVELLHKPDDLDFAWLTADGVRDPRAYQSTSPDLSATFHDVYPGGWQELFPNAGVPSQTRWGAQFGQHGEVALLPWDAEVLEDRPERVAVRFSVRTQKTPFRVERVVRLSGEEAAFTFEGTATNESDVPLEATWGHHVTFGPPFLHPGCRIVMPAGVDVFPHPSRGGKHRWLEAEQTAPWPRLRANPEAGWPEELVDLGVLPPRGTPSEMSYITGFGADAWYAVESDRHGLGARVSWDGERFPFLWHWHEYGAGRGYPWYGRHYNIGLEPNTSWSPSALPGAVENGTAMALAPRETKTAWLRFEAYPVTGGSAAGDS